MRNLDNVRIMLKNPHHDYLMRIYHLVESVEQIILNKNTNNEAECAESECVKAEPVQAE